MQCSSIAAIPRFERLVLLARHAERYPVTDIRTHAAVRLTEQGREDARAFGRALARFEDLLLWHSPILRCRETAECIAFGVEEAGGRVRVGGPLEWLGDALIRGEPMWVNECIAAEGPHGFLRRWFDGDYPSGRIAPSDDAAAAHLEHVLLQLAEAGPTVVVDITHDWNLLLVRERYLGLSHEEVGLPPYLDSIAVLERGSETLLWSQGRSARLRGPGSRE